MKFTGFLTSALFAASIIASPTPELWPRAQESRLSGQVSHVGSPVNLGNVTFAPSGGSNVITDIWAGAGFSSPPSGQSYELITGRFKVPTVSGTNSVVSIWVGIDGYLTNKICIQGGIYITTDANGAATYQSWTEWYPDGPVFKDQSFLAFNPGDVLTIGIAVTAGATTADFIIENLTTGDNKDITFSPTDSANKALGQTAEWVVERPNGFTLVNFGTVDIENIVLQTASAGIDLSNADTIGMRRSPMDATTIAQGVKTGSNSVRITYTGP